jgi:hypothetical protein
MMQTAGARAAAVGLLAAMAVGGCAGVRTQTDFDPTADFRGYRTYTWVTEEPLMRVEQGKGGAVSPLVQQRIRDAIDRTLAGRGYRQEKPGDFAVAFTVGVRERQYLSHWYPYDPFYYRGRYWRYPPQPVIETYAEGTLVIDIFEVASQRPVWTGRATKLVGEADAAAEQIDAVVAEVLKEFPPKPDGQ